MQNKYIILITGGTGKIGSILVKHFAYAGHKVYFTSRNPEKISELHANILKNNSECFVKGIEIDHLDANSTDKIINEFINQNDYPNILINNVRNLSFLTDNDHSGLPTTNAWIGELTLAVMMPNELTMKMIHQNANSLTNVINISSIYGLVAPNPNLYDSYDEMVPIHYGIAKAAQIHLTKELAVRLSRYGVRVNGVAFGGIKGRANPTFVEKYSKHCPHGKMLDEEDVIGPVDFLLSPASSGMTGHNLIVDGGWTVW